MNDNNNHTKAENLSFIQMSTFCLDDGFVVIQWQAIIETIGDQVHGTYQ